MVRDIRLWTHHLSHSPHQSQGGEIRPGVPHRRWSPQGAAERQSMQGSSTGPVLPAVPSPYMYAPGPTLATPYRPNAAVGPMETARDGPQGDSGVTAG